MEDRITQAELKEALLEALIDYEAYKKKRRIKTVKKTLQNTMLVTLIGSSGLMAANQNRTNSVEKTPALTASEIRPVPAVEKLAPTAKHTKYIPGVAHFSFNRHSLSKDQQNRLSDFIKQLPEDAEISIIGCTDSVGNSVYNQKLGLERARAVAEFLGLHGIKVISTESKISIDMPEKWMARRVDIIVNTSSPFYLTTSAREAVPVISASQQIENSPNAGAKESIKVAVQNELPQSAQSDKLKLQQDTAQKTAALTDKEFPVTRDVDNYFEPAALRQRIRGIAHFPMNSYSLALAHQERLIALLKQLPKDAQITVIGRTEARSIETDETGISRAKSVALFLANHGITIKAIGTKETANGFTGWGSRAVDLIVDSGSGAKLIDLPKPTKDEFGLRNKEIPLSKGYIGRVPSPYLYKQN